MNQVYMNDNVPQLDASFSGCRASSKMMSGMAWILCLIFSTIAFLLPALWNGFAIVFFDTGGYLDRVLTMSLYPGRSFLYALFLWVASFGWASFWGPILLQSLLCLWMIHLMLRLHDLPAGPTATAIFCIGLSLLTGISWYTSQLMPDILVSLVILALWLLGFHWHRLRLCERIGLLATALLGLMSHNSSLALGIGLIAVILILHAAVYQKDRSITINILPPVAIVTAGFVLIPMLNLSLTGKATYASGGPVFLFARFVQEGIAQRWLAENCPITNIKLCKMQKRIPNTSEGFLWARNSPLRDLGNWTGAAANAELGYVVTESLKDYPGKILRASLQATSQQFFMVETGDGLDNYQDYTRKVFSNFSPQIAQSFNKAQQQDNQFKQQLFDTLNRVHVPVAYLSMLGLMIVIGWGLIVKRSDLVCLALFVFFALLGNAFICGALSGPFNRYQSRLIWLATLVVCMAGVSQWQRSRKLQC